MDDARPRAGNETRPPAADGTSAQPLRIRPGAADDVPAVLGLFDRAVEWLVARGRTGQWGTKPWSENPKAVALVERYLTSGEPWIAEIGGVVAGAVTLTDGPGPGVPEAAGPERYVHLLVADHRFAGRGVGRALLAHAADETRRQGIPLLRVDCYAGDDRKLVAYYESNGFAATEAFTGPDGSWPGQILEMRV
ncbi:GNAT family N-acetyltransferase [Streptomyces sp. A1499]|uniref:GNAT family N-acetyltransferase n=1 Tax=Streptomyces sp. A1499 TaxID=2563104 RepID=UPI00109EAFB7|nr:GNAT family N-acetyltransferase [Streptomyces sp. A1499]THC47717.1 GNAT family N-acetyltransferase [Streptomyces sp. A1499]